MNTMISQKNSEIQNKIKDNKINFNSSHHENEILKLKDLNNNLISDNKFLQDEYKKLEKKYDLIKNKYDITLKENQGKKKKKKRKRNYITRKRKSL